MRHSPTSIARIVEINPLVITKADEVIALDAKISFDDNALFRHANWKNCVTDSEEDPKELEAEKYDLNYVALDGNIGLHGERRRAGDSDHGHHPAMRYVASPISSMLAAARPRNEVTAAFKGILSRSERRGNSGEHFQRHHALRRDLPKVHRCRAPAMSACRCLWWSGLEGTNVELEPRSAGRRTCRSSRRRDLADAATEKIVTAVKETAMTWPSW